MLAFLGFIIQHNVTGKGPFDNLLQHISDPWHNTIVQTLGGNQNVCIIIEWHESLCSSHVNPEWMNFERHLGMIVKNP